MEIKLNKNAVLIKILDTFIDYFFKNNEVSDDLEDFIELFEIDTDDIEYLVNNLDDTFTNSRSEIFDAFYSKIEDANWRNKYSFFINDKDNYDLSNNIKKVISLVYIYNNFQDKLNSLEFLISIRYLSYDYWSFLFDIDGRIEAEVISFGEMLENNESKNTQPDKAKQNKAIFDRHKGQLYYESNDALVKFKNPKQLDNYQYYFFEKGNILNKHSIENDSFIKEYDISNIYISLITVSQLKEASFEQSTKNFEKLMSLASSKKEIQEPPSIKIDTNSFIKLYKFFSDLFTKDKFSFRYYVVSLVYNVINRNYNSKSLNTKYIIVGYICSEFDIDIEDKEGRTNSEYHSYLKYTVTNILNSSNSKI